MPNDQPDQTNQNTPPPVYPQPVTPPVPEPPKPEVPPAPIVTEEIKTETVIPPMPEQSVETPIPDGSSAPQDTPPMVTNGGPTTKKKFGGGKFIPTILGLLILTGAVSAGAYLVKQNQDIREKAYIPCEEECDTGYHCNPQTGLCIENTYCTDGTVQTSACGIQVNGVSCSGTKEITCENGTWVTTVDCTLNDPDCGSTTPDGLTACQTNPAQIGCPCVPGQEAYVWTEVVVEGVTRIMCVGPNGDYCDPAEVGDPCQEFINGVWTSVPCCNLGIIKCQCGSGWVTAVVGEDACLNGTVSCDSICEDEECENCDEPENPQCTTVKAYTTDWTALTAAQLAVLDPGTVVYFTVVGANGTFTQARFKITGDTTWQTPVTTKKPSSNEFYTEYTLPTTGGTITVEAQIGTADGTWY